MNIPLQPLAPAQRVAWLVHFALLKCRRSTTGFDKSRTYPIITETVKVQSKERRARRDGISEPVTFTGHELVVRIKDNAGNWHRCLPAPAAAHALIHDFVFLVKHFAIPEVPDVAKLNPKKFAAMKRRLRLLES